MTIFRRAAAVVFVFLTAFGSARADAIRTLDITARPIENFRIGSVEKIFGSFQFVGGLEMTASSLDFGSISAFRFLSPGRDFMAVADTGYWVFGSIEHDAEGRPSGMSHFQMSAMSDRTGTPAQEKQQTDAEGLAVRDGMATVSFERVHRIAEFKVDPGNMDLAEKTLDFLVPAKELRHNRGFETVAYSPPGSALAGARVAITEKSLDKNGDCFAAVLEGPLKGVFSVRRSDGFDITDGGFLPGGDLMLLERRFTMAEGVAMRVRRISGDAIRAGARVDGPIVLEASMAYQIDNMEGLDVWQRADGAVMMSIVSDDNHSLLQRNLYLEFQLIAE